jgi:hypothetical protein
MFEIFALIRLLVGSRSLTLKDEAQNPLFKDPVRTAL